jgi:hypothetical protein
MAPQIWLWRSTCAEARAHQAAWSSRWRSCVTDVLSHPQERHAGDGFRRPLRSQS